MHGREQRNVSRGRPKPKAQAKAKAKSKSATTAKAQAEDRCKAIIPLLTLTTAPIGG